MRAAITGILSGLAAAILAASAAPATAQTAPPPPPPCTDGARLKVICGFKGPEDLVQVPGADWIIVSGLGEGANPASTNDAGGGLGLIDPAAHTGRKLAFTGAGPKAPYLGCSGPPDSAHFQAHGLNIQGVGRGRARLFVVGHGGREAIEVFDVATGKRAPPALTWIGCIAAPEGAYHNSVAALKDGRVVVTDFLHKPSTFRDLLSGKTTGAVYVWAPGGTLTKLPGTDLGAPNGIEVTPDGRHVFVAVSGTSRILRWELTATDKPPTVIDPGQRTDNLRWGPGGKLLAAGPDTRGCPPTDNRCAALSVVALDPNTLALTTLMHTKPEAGFNALSSALTVNGTLWLGSPTGDRVAYTTPDK
jgi:hypothetical protein